MGKNNLFNSNNSYAEDNIAVPTTEESTELPSGDKTGVATRSVNVRKASSSTAPVVHTLSAGEKVKIEGESGGFYKVNTRNKIGYVMKQYLKEE